ncbi:MAG: EamA family transporter, partial [Spirochaetes bacterium]|nr:EamA family transporter [Spirochaetota bacterium]
AQILLKIGMKGFDLVKSDLTVLDKIKRMVLDPLIISAVLCYGTGFILYAFVLSKMELSKAYPVASVAAISMIFIFSILFMNETFNIPKIIGLFLCCVGIFFIFR